MREDKEYQILIVDDQPDNAFLLEMLLRRQPNFKISVVENGKEALEYVAENDVDLVLMDVMMPIMDGIEATSEIRKNFPISTLPIIMVTTLSDTENLVKSFNVGASDYVSKPVEWHALKARICSGLRVRDASLARDELLRKTNILNQRLKQFSFSVAHDIRNPLAHIRVLCSAMGDDIMSPEEGLEQVDELAEKAYSFLDSILEHSAYGRSEDTVSVDMNELVNDVTKFLGASIESNHAEIVCDSLPRLKGSYGLFFQLILNLVGNALKYHDASRSPMIEIGGEHDEEFEVITIKDNGQGIAEEDLEMVMEPLTRGKSSEGTSGSGLGLSLGANIMEEYQGKLVLTSKEGEGTTVRLSFPKSLRAM
ncbi:MAG: response regulator [Planctomycetes bacterium]|nr:response regulator [Planctomycetota bacterium]